MWTQFFIGCAVIIVELYLPSFILLLPTGMNRISALCISPAVSIFLSTAVEIGILSTGNTCTTILVETLSVLLALVLSTALYLVFRSLHLSPIKSVALTHRTTAVMFLYIVISLVAVGLFFVKGLDGPYSYFQGWDNTHHLSSIRYFADSGQWHPLFTNRYLSSEVTPYIDNANTFYPSAWHILCATIVSIFDAPASLGANCVNAILLSIVYPLSIFGLLNTVFNNDLKVLLAGSLLSLGIAACPWDYVIYGPLFPNLLSTCLIPTAITLFISLTNSLSNKNIKAATIYFALFCISLTSVVVAHPNGVFSLILILAPFVTYTLSKWMKDRYPSKTKRYIAIFLFWLLIVLFWIICFNLPFFQGVVTVVWPAIKSLPESILDLLNLGIVNHPGQPYVAILLIIGLISIARHASHRWLLGSFILAALTYILDAGTDGFAKSLITGFWYTDYHRTGAMYGFVASIVCICGLACVINELQKLVTKHPQGAKSGAVSLCSFTTMLLYIMSGILIYFPGYDELGIDQTSTAFGYQYREFANQNDIDLVYYDILTSEEINFCENVSLSIARPKSLLSKLSHPRTRQ